MSEERKWPANNVAEIMRMCEDADLKDLIIIMDQVDQDKHLYTPKQLNDVLFFISARRKKIESDKRWKEGKIPVQLNEQQTRFGYRLKSTDVFSLHKEAESKGLVGEKATEYVHARMQEDGEWF